MSEGEAIAAIDKALEKLQDADARTRVLQWAWQKFGPDGNPPSVGADGAAASAPKSSNEGAETRNKSAKRAKKPAAKKTNVALVKDLNLKPKQGKSFDDFVAEKQPKSNHAKCTVAVYYLNRLLDIDQVTVNHVYTCFKHANWRVPADLANTLAWTSSQKGLLDTKKLDSIKLTTIGENLIEHDLPAAKKE